MYVPRPRAEIVRFSPDNNSVIGPMIIVDGAGAAFVLAIWRVALLIGFDWRKRV